MSSTIEIRHVVGGFISGSLLGVFFCLSSDLSLNKAYRFHFHLSLDKNPTQSIHDFA